MKYGIFFLILSVFCFWYSLNSIGWNTLVAWPASNFFAIAIAYFGNFHQIFGKRSDGRLNKALFLFFLPYHLLLYLTWNSIRLLQSENAFDSINDRISIGRRLTEREFDPSFETVIDLTAELYKPLKITESTHYVSFPILDASSPSIARLETLIRDVEKQTGKIFIHCAQGHGRTGLVTAAVLMSADDSLSPADAVSEIQRFRPALKCNPNQLSTLSQLRENKTIGGSQ